MPAAPTDSSVLVSLSYLPGAIAMGQIVIKPKKFATGSDGFWGNGKVIDPNTGEKYQASINLVRVGSKNSKD